MTDEIMAEVRRIRDEYVAAHGNDLDAVYADLKHREATSKRPLADLAALHVSAAGDRATGDEAAQRARP